ncbi:Regulating synaptic membrane exocytosis protein 1 [Bienertia sinuspersici]
MDLNMMMKRGKLAGKALKNLMFHHNPHSDRHISATQGGGVGGPTKRPEDVPLDRHHYTNKRKNNYHHHKKSTQFYTPLPYFMQDVESVDLEEVNNMVLRNEEVTASGPTATPGLAHRWSPAVRQLRITDSPFPLQNSEDSKYVDQAAEDFIKRFYSKLNHQNYC